MSESGDSLRGKLSARGERALGEIAQALLENPIMNQLLQTAFGARDATSQATASAIKNLHLATAEEMDRLARRLRATSERLEAVEDRLDQLLAEVAALRRSQQARRDEPA